MYLSFLTRFGGLIFAIDACVFDVVGGGVVVVSFAGIALSWSCVVF